MENFEIIIIIYFSHDMKAKRCIEDVRQNSHKK